MRPLFFDLDGVFADFYGFAARLLGRPYREVPSAEAWAVLDQVPNLFQQLPLLEDGRLLWEGLKRYYMHPQAFLTALPNPTGQLITADADKRIWVAHELSRTLPVITVQGGANKVRFVVPGAVLIDDLARNIDLWQAAGGVGILHVNATQTLAQLAAICAEPWPASSTPSNGDASCIG